jgi:hypothetical protein
MIVPLSIKIGNVGLETASDKSSSELALDENSQFENICRAWDEVKNIVDRKLREWEYECNYKTRHSLHDPKIKLILEIVRALSERGIKEKILIDEILKTEKFSEGEARIYVKRALQDGSIKMLEDGLYHMA